jgi:hypothetical protein
MFDGFLPFLSVYLHRNKGIRYSILIKEDTWLRPSKAVTQNTQDVSSSSRLSGTALDMGSFLFVLWTDGRGSSSDVFKSVEALAA